MTQSRPQVSLSIDSLHVFLSHTMMYVTQQHSFAPDNRFLAVDTTLTQNCFFPRRWVQFSTNHSDSPIVGARDIGQIHAYTCKPHELPLEISKGPLHFVQYKGSTNIIRYYTANESLARLEFLLVKL